MRKLLSLRLLFFLFLLCSSGTLMAQCPSVGGSVQGGATICQGQRGPILRLSGNNGSVIRWERSINNGQSWLQIANTTINLDPGVVTTTTCYRAVVRIGNCTPARSLSTCITVNPDNSVAGTVTQNQTLCSGQQPAALNLAGQTGNIVRWESSVDSVTWTAITNTTASFTPPTLTRTTWFRAVVQSGTCPVKFSVAAKITVGPQTNEGLINPASIQACSVQNSGTLVLQDFNGTIIRWEQSTDEGLTWNPIANVTPTLVYSALGAGTYTYRAIVQSGGCAPRPSLPSVIFVQDPPVAGTITSDLPGDELCNGQQQRKGKLTLAGHTAEILRWEYIEGDGDWPKTTGEPERDSSMNIIEWTGDVYNILKDGNVKQGNAQRLGTNGFLDKTYTFRAVVRNQTCGEVFSEAIVITVDKECCTPPVIDPNYVIEYDPTAVTDEWTELDVVIKYTEGKGDPAGHNVRFRKKGDDFTPEPGTDITGTEFKLADETTVLDNVGYDVIITKNCDDPGVDPSFSLSDTITCWVCTRVNPSRISVDNVSDTSADITWFDQTSGAYYIIEWNLLQTGNDWVVIDSVRGVQEYTITGLTPQTAYRFRVTKLCFVDGRWVTSYAPSTASPVASRRYNQVRFTTTGTFPECNNFRQFNWAKTAGSGTGNDQGQAITVDNEGYVYALGIFKGNFEIGSYTVSSNSNVYDYYLAKYDPFGTPIWVKRIGCGSTAEFSESGNALTTDNQGNVYVTGRFYGSAAFGNTTVTSAGLGDIFVAKFRTTDGTHLWVKRAGGTLEDAGFGIELGNDNKILYLAGKVTGTVGFGSTVSTGPNTNSDLFLAKYSTQDGSVEWVRRTGNALTDDAARNVVTDELDNAYLTGYIGGNPNQPDVNFGSITVSNNLDVENAFVASYDRLGNVQWAKNIKNAYSEGDGIDLDPQGNLVVAGWFAGSMQFKGETINSTNEEFALVPSVDFFVLKLEGKSGRDLIYTTGGGNRDDYARDVITDSKGGVYVTGHFASPTINVNWNGNVTNNALPKLQGDLTTSDVMVAKLNPNLSVKTAFASGSRENDDRATGIVVDSREAVYILGDYKGTGLFAKDTLTSSGGTWDAFIGQISCDKLITCELEPRNVFVANIDNNTVSVNWTREAGVTNYDLRYRATNSQTWISRNAITTPPFIIGNLFAGLKYEVQVRSNCAPGGAGTGPSLWSDPVEFTTITVGSCGVPTSLDVDNTFNNELLVVWDKIPGAAYYEVQWRPINTPNWMPMSPNPAARADSNMYLIPDLQSNVRYDIRVRSICSERLTSAYSSVIRSTTNSGSCPIPFNITAQDITPNSAVVTWTAAVSAFEYDVQWRKLGTNTWSVVTTRETSAKIDFLEENTKYEYRVRSRCGATTNVSPYADKQIFTTNPVCSLPANFSVSVFNVLDKGKSEMTLSWDAVVPAAKMYYIEYKTVSETVFQVDSSRVNQITLTNLLPGTCYNLRMRVFCGNNNVTEYSPIRTECTETMCESPRLLEAATITTSSLNIRWVGPVDAVGYKVEYKKATDATFNTPPRVIAVNETDLLDLVPGTDYDVCVTTICSDGATSTKTCIVAKTADCVPPANVRIKTGSLTTSSVIIEWDIVPGAKNYILRWFDSSTNREINNSGTITSRNFEIKSLNENTKYYVTVSVDCGSGVSLTSSNFEFTTAQTCEAPTNLAVVDGGITPTQAPFTWTRTSSATGYVLYWKVNNDIGIERSLDLDATADSYVLNQLLPNTEYQVCIAARCGNGLSPRAQCVIFKTKGTGTGCFTPSIILPITVFRNSATVRWSFVPEATSYTISWRRFGGSQWTSTTISDPNTTSFDITNLISNTTYVVRVRARCPLGFTDWSEAQFTTLTGRVGDESISNVHSLYPNPNNGNFTIRFNSEEGGDAKIHIFDMQGKMVFEQNHQAQSGENELNISANELSAGIYTVRFVHNGNTQTVRITVIE